MNIEHVFAQALEQKLNAELDLYRYDMEEQIRGDHKTVWSMNPVVVKCGNILSSKTFLLV